MNRLGISLICLFSILLVSADKAEKRATASLFQSNGDNWSLPIDLAANREGRSLHPILIADEADGLHLFWDEVSDVPGGTEVMVDYAYWDGFSWSEPIDIFVGVRGQLALGANGDIDERGYLHTVWIDELGLMYGLRHVSSPVAATSWEDRQRLVTETGGNVHMPVLKIDDDGNLHLIVLITDSQPGVYYLSSPDRGKTWESPRLISDPSVTNWRQGRQRHQLDLLPIDGAIHAVWQHLDDAGNGSIVYSRGFDAGSNWSAPISVQGRGSWPKLAFLDNGDLLLSSVGHDEEGRICMKRHVTSKDLGQTWSPTEIVFDPVKGCLGSAPFATDGDGGQHLVMSAYDSNPIVERIWHAIWNDGKWENPEELNWTGISYRDKDLGTQPDFPSMAVTNGNLMHVVFMTDEGNVWYTRKLLNVSSLSPIIYPTPESVTIQEMSSPESTGNQEEGVEQSFEGQSNGTITTPEFDKDANSQSPLLNPFFVGLIPAVVLISIVVLIARRKGLVRR